MPSSIVLERDFISAKRSLREAVHNSVPANQLPELARSLVDANTEIVKEHGLQGLQESVEAKDNNIPVFDVILPTEPHDSLLNEISHWFRGQIHQNALLKLSIRRSIGGGIVVRSKNRIFDMSFRPRIMGAKDKIPEVMRRV